MFSFLKRKPKTNPLEEIKKRQKEQKEEIWNRLMTAKKEEENKILEQKITDSYRELNFEEKAKYFDSYRNEKQLFTYDVSEEIIKQKNPKARHARPQEAFGLIIHCLEDKIHDEKLLKVKEDMLKSQGEWLSCAFERQGNKLIVYLDPTGIKWNGNEYIKTENFKFTEKKEFDITGINSQSWTDLNKFSDEFVKYIYGRKFNELPQEMKEEGKRARVYLSPDGKFWPIYRGGCNNDYGIATCIYYSWASRGVAVVERA